MRIAVRRFGELKEDFAQRVFKIIHDCYERTGDIDVKLVDLYLFESASLMRAFLHKEKKELGIKTSAFEYSFFALHDAWRGIPRIMVAYDRLLSLPETVAESCLIHEAAHTLLHGSLEHYSFSIPAVLLELIEEEGISRQLALDLLYLVSIAVKDYEVSRLLYKCSFLEELNAYVGFFLEPSQEDVEEWGLVKDHRLAKLLYLTSLLKTLCCAVPLLRDEEYGEGITGSIARSIEFLSSDLREDLMDVIDTCLEFGEDTHFNVDLLLTGIVDKFTFTTK